MGASEKAVAEVMETPEMGCVPNTCWCEVLGTCDGKRRCGSHRGVWTDRGCPVAVTAADAAVDTDRPSIQAQALREAAGDPINPPIRSRYAIRRWLHARADRIEAQP